MAADLILRFDTFPSPFGPLTVVAGDAGVVATGFGDEEPLLDRQVERFSTVPVRDRGAMAAYGEEVAAYFERRLRRFRTRVDLSWARTPFFAGVYRVAMEVPYGHMRTYGDIAAGHAMAVCPIELWIPCHRVVPAGPGFGSYGGEEDRRTLLLRLEGAI